MEEPKRAGASGRQAMGAVRTGASVITAPLRWLVRPFVVRVSSDGTKVTFVSYSKMIYLWPFIPLGIIASILATTGIVTGAALGWLTVVAIFLSWVVLAEDIDIRGATVIGLLVVLFFALGILSKTFWNVPYLSWIHGLFANLHVGSDAGLPRGLATLVALCLAVYVVPKAFLVGRHEITSQEISQLRFMMGSVSHPRTGKKVKIEFNDLFEMVIGLGGGRITLYDQSGKPELVVPNILFLKLFEDEIEEVLESVGIREVRTHEATGPTAFPVTP